jgi:hypothetical protein
MKKLTDILNEIKINNPLAVAARDRASKEQEMDEIKINQPDPKRPTLLLEVIKDRYLCTGRTREGDYHTKDEIFDNFAHLFVVGDIWNDILNKFENKIIVYNIYPTKGTRRFPLNPSLI